MHSTTTTTLMWSLLLLVVLVSAREYVTTHRGAAAAAAGEKHRPAHRRPPPPLPASKSETKPHVDVAHVIDAAALIAMGECEYKRADAIECALRYIDADKDGRICKEEVQQTLDKVIGFWESVVTLWYSANYVMAHCDADEDGFISMEDFARSEEKCLHDCFPRRIFFENVCARLTLLPEPLPPVKCVPPPPKTEKK